jgi:tetratricopeptide (TPR) repeat protein
MALLFKGIVTYLANDLKTAQALLEESIHVGQGLDAHGHESWAHEFLGQVYTMQGKVDQGTAMLEEIPLGETKTTFPDSYANKMLALGNALRLQGNLERALDCYRESLPAHHGIGFLARIPAHLDAFAHIAALQGQDERSAKLFGAAQAGRERYEIPVPPVERAEYDASLTSLRQTFGEARLVQLLAEGRAMKIEEAVAYAME